MARPMRPSSPPPAPLALRRCLPGLALAALLAGCGPRPPWRVQDLPAAPLPRRSAAELATCSARLALTPEQSRPAHATNFGARQPRDSWGRTLPHEPRLIVLHETVISAPATVKLFTTPHPRDEDQVSYHLLVDREGRRLRIVADEGRAFGAGMSAFGDMTVRVRPASLGSINNVALHLSLETPADGRGDGDAHSGYTEPQYRSAAAQVLLWQGRWGIPLSRLTTHAAVDRSRSRTDPRSFRWERFEREWKRAAGLCGWTGYDTGRATL